MNAKWILMCATGMVLAVALAVAVAQPPAGKVFDRGTAAFHAGHYAQALADFKEARRLGLKGPQLSYDLGVTYYRLGRYTESRREFIALAHDPALAALSHYNLGLIALRQHDKVRARAEFNQAYSRAQAPALRRLASAALGSLGRAPLRGPHWTAFAVSSAGYDSNVALTSESTVLTPARRSSGAYSLLAGAISQLSGTSQQGWQAVGTYYRIDYPAVSQFNQTYLHAGGQYRWHAGGWSHMLGFYGGALTLGNASFETLATLSADTRFRLTPENDLHLFYHYTRIKGGSSYDYLTGLHQSLGIEDTWHLRRMDLSLGYTFDFNERNNYNTPSQFLSASPTDNGLYLQLNWRLNDATRIYMQADYQHSHYQGADLLMQGTASTSIFREENLWNASLGMAYSLSPHWSLRLDGSFADNRSNIPQYSYHSTVLMSSLEYVFSH